MTNSRLTDPEVLEFRFPVRLESYEIRHGSGGGGRYPGGDGGVRRMRFLEDMTAAILSNNRLHAPFGLSGGQPGAMGRNYVERADGTVQPLGPQDSAQLRPGDVFVVETPGGGGYGAVGAGRPSGAARGKRQASREWRFRIVHHVQRDLRARLAVVHAQRDFAVADLEHGGGQRVLAIGVMPVRAQDRQCALGIVQRCQQLAPPVAGDQLSTMPSMRCWRARDESVTTCGRPAVSAWIMWLAWP